MPSNLNLARWVARLGWKRTDQPETIYAIQPVQLMGDVSSLVPQIRGPSAVMGCGQATTPAQIPQCDFHVTAPGGALFRDWTFFTNAGMAVEMQFSGAALGNYDTGPFTSVPQVMQGPFTTTMVFGTSLTIVADPVFPELGMSGNQGHATWCTGGSPGLWVPPGIHLILRGRSIGTNLQNAVLVQELPGEFGA